MQIKDVFQGCNAICSRSIFFKLGEGRLGAHPHEISKMNPYFLQSEAFLDPFHSILEGSFPKTISWQIKHVFNPFTAVSHLGGFCGGFRVTLLRFMQ